MSEAVRSRRSAAAAFIARRGELGMTQEDVAGKAGVAVRTVQNFEYGVWPSPRTRARIERAVGWPAGEIHRLGSPPQALVDPRLLDRISELSDEQFGWLITWATATESQRRAGKNGELR